MNLIAKITLSAVAASSLLAGEAHAQNRTLVLLQENSGRSSLSDWMPTGIRAAVEGIVDQFVESSESAKFAALAAAKYAKFVNLSDGSCTRANLLATLVNESSLGNVVDLAVLGHGSDEFLALNSAPHLTGATKTAAGAIVTPGTIRTLLTEARAQRGANFNFTLRVVHMCNCFGSTVNDDWLAIGAKVSVGSRRNNYMPEPTLSWFWDDFAKNDKRVVQAAADSFAAATPLWSIVPGYLALDPSTGLTKIQESQPIVAGATNLIFRDEMQMAVGQTKTITVAASSFHRFAPVYAMPGQTYRVSATGTWRNGAIAASPNGYAPGFFDGLRRHPSNMLRLISERMGKFGDTGTAIAGSALDIGSSRDITPGGFGFLSLWANDMAGGYGDNTGSLTVTVRRLQ
jgi:hypothetical protein